MKPKIKTQHKTTGKTKRKSFPDNKNIHHLIATKHNNLKTTEALSYSAHKNLENPNHTMNLNNRTLGAFAKKKKPFEKKPTPLAKIMRDIKQKASGNKFVIKYVNHFYKNGKKVKEDAVKKFRYNGLTNYCLKILQDHLKAENITQLLNNYVHATFVRDMIMEGIDPKFNRNNPTKFRGMDCIK